MLVGQEEPGKRNAASICDLQRTGVHVLVQAGLDMILGGRLELPSIASAREDRLCGVMPHGKAALQEEAARGCVPIHHFSESEDPGIAHEGEVR